MALLIGKFTQELPKVLLWWQVPPPLLLFLYQQIVTSPSLHFLVVILPIQIPSLHSASQYGVLGLFPYVDVRGSMNFYM